MLSCLDAGGRSGDITKQKRKLSGKCCVIFTSLGPSGISKNCHYFGMKCACKARNMVDDRILTAAVIIIIELSEQGLPERAS